MSLHEISIYVKCTCLYGCNAPSTRVCGNGSTSGLVLQVLRGTKFPPNRDRSNVSGVDKETTDRYLKNSNYTWRGVKGNPCSSFTIGYIKPRRCPKNAPKVLSKSTLRNKKLYELCRRYIQEIKPDFQYTSICVNKNVHCLPHVDANNIGQSLIVGLGDYTGGDLFIDDTRHNIRYSPVVFNGAKETHWNDQITSGTKYSLVYFST